MAKKLKDLKKSRVILQIIFRYHYLLIFTHEKAAFAVIKFSS